MLELEQFIDVVSSLGGTLPASTIAATIIDWANNNLNKHEIQYIRQLTIAARCQNLPLFCGSAIHLKLGGIEEERAMLLFRLAWLLMNDADMHWINTITAARINQFLRV